MGIDEITYNNRQNKNILNIEWEVEIDQTAGVIMPKHPTLVLRHTTNFVNKDLMEIGTSYSYVDYWLNRQLELSMDKDATFIQP